MRTGGVDYLAIWSRSNRAWRKQWTRRRDRGEVESQQTSAKEIRLPKIARPPGEEVLTCSIAQVVVRRADQRVVSIGIQLDHHRRESAGDGRHEDDTHRDEEKIPSMHGRAIQPV